MGEDAEAQARALKAAQEALEELDSQEACDAFAADNLKPGSRSLVGLQIVRALAALTPSQRDALLAGVSLPEPHRRLLVALRENGLV